MTTQLYAEVFYIPKIKKCTTKATFSFGFFILKMITQKQLKQFKRIYKKLYGKKLSDKETLELSTKLLQLIKLTYKSKN